MARVLLGPRRCLHCSPGRKTTQSWLMVVSFCWFSEFLFAPVHRFLITINAACDWTLDNTYLCNLELELLILNADKRPFSHINVKMQL